MTTTMEPRCHPRHWTQDDYEIYDETSTRLGSKKDPDRFGPLIGYSILAAMSVGGAIMLGAPFVAPYLVGR